MLNICVYRKPKPERSGDEVRQGWVLFDTFGPLNRARDRRIFSRGLRLVSAWKKRNHQSKSRTAGEYGGKGANTRYQAVATPYLGRSFTGRTAPASPGAQAIQYLTMTKGPGSLRFASRW